MKEIQIPVPPSDPVILSGDTSELPCIHSADVEFCFAKSFRSTLS